MSSATASCRRRTASTRTTPTPRPTISTTPAAGRPRVSRTTPPACSGRTAGAATGTRRTTCRRQPWSAARRPGTGTTRTASASGRSLGGGDSTYYLRGPLGVLSEFEGAGDLLGWSVDYIYAAGRLIADDQAARRRVAHDRRDPSGGAGTVTQCSRGAGLRVGLHGPVHGGVVGHADGDAERRADLRRLGRSCGTGTSPTVDGDDGDQRPRLHGDVLGRHPEALTVTKTGSGSGTVTSAPGGDLVPGHLRGGRTRRDPRSRSPRRRRPARGSRAGAGTAAARRRRPR